MQEETEVRAGSGDIRIRREGAASEVSIPFGQYMRLILAIFILFAAVTGIALLLEHWSLYGAGLLICLVVAGMAARQRGSSRVAAMLVTCTLLAAWLVGGYKIARAAWIFPRVDWPWQLRAWAILGISVVLCAPTALIAYRYAAEVVDPSGPTAPRKPVDRSTTVWPWTHEPEPEPEPAELTREDIEELMAEMLAQRQETLRIETVRGDGDGRVPVGGGISIDEIPYGRQALPSAARRWKAGQMRWSRRELARLPGIGETKARKLRDALIERHFLTYPDGNENHPDGAQPTGKFRALLKALSGGA